MTASCFPYSEARIVSYGPGHQIVGDGDPTDNCFLVVRGMFRAVKVTADGKQPEEIVEEIVGHLPLAARPA